MRAASGHHRSPTIVILGAARSGTNLLRDILTAHPGADTWPCDEINYIWRYGNREVPHDEFERAHARDEVIRYVRRSFHRRARHSDIVVEKTCANTLRVGFVDAILPEARYVVIERDPYDAIASAMARWRGDVRAVYLLKKARFVPTRDVTYYARRYLANRHAQKRSQEGRLATWGPRFVGIDEAAFSEPLHRVCARQWGRCVRRCEVGIERIPVHRVHRIKYEELVADPADSVALLTSFAFGEPSRASVSFAVANLFASSVGAAQALLSEAQLAEIRAVLGEGISS